MNAYGLLAAIAIGVGYWVVLTRAKLYKIPESLLDSLFVPVVLGGVIGARAYHVLDKWSYYSSNFWAIFRIWEGGLGIFGGILGGLGGLIFYLKLKKIKINILDLLDLAAPSVALGQAIGRWGNYFNNEVLGPNGEPIFFYESLWMFLGFLVLIKIKTKSLFGVYLIWYGVGRFVLEFWRTDTATLGQFKTAQIISLIFIMLGLILVFRKSKVKS